MHNPVFQVCISQVQLSKPYFERFLSANAPCNMCSQNPIKVYANPETKAVRRAADLLNPNPPSPSPSPFPPCRSPPLLLPVQVITILTANYPARLARLCIVDPPRIAQWALQARALPRPPPPLHFSVFLSAVWRTTCCRAMLQSHPPDHSKMPHGTARRCCTHSSRR